MSRFEDFVYFKDNQIEDLNAILEHRGVTVDIYRPVAGSKPGFSSELGEPTRLARILAYISSNAVPTQVGRADMRANLQEYVGLTNYADCRISDIWKDPSGDEYKVRAVLKELDSSIVQVDLEKIE
jgi:hypothetical protein